jgi:phospholipase C
MKRGQTLRRVMRFAPLAGLILILLAGSGRADPLLERGPAPGPELRPYLSDPARRAPRAELIAALRRHVRYVFVLYQENRSFDAYFGSFPGAHGLYSAPPASIPGFTQPILDPEGREVMIHPFRLGPKDYAADLDDMDHSHPRLVEKLHFTETGPKMDRFAWAEEMKYVKPGAPPGRAAFSHGALPMAHVDCDTIPFLWQWASRFVLFDDFFQEALTPSAPNAIAVIAGQTGETQWVKHPEQKVERLEGYGGAGEPMEANAPPFWGSPGDHQSGLPAHPVGHAAPALNQTYATLMLTLLGREAGGLAATDRDPAGDLADIRRDIEVLRQSGAPSVPWAWYQEGFDYEPNDPPATRPQGTHQGYVWHHNGPQYFGYLANDPEMARHLHGLADAFDDIAGQRLPKEGGVFYIRGGYRNIWNLVPAAPDPRIRAKFRGDDDHPGYSDSEISEVLLARLVNAIAQSPYWAESAILITFDEGGGAYDHVPPRILVRGPDGTVLSRGPRIPLLVISPYARADVVSHEEGDHNAILRFIEALFGRPALASLPDEREAIEEGRREGLGDHLGPKDEGVAGEGDLLSAFDPDRLFGRRAPLPPAYAMIAPARLEKLPLDGGAGCRVIGVAPVDLEKGIDNSPPPGFNPRPETVPEGS